jgi:hypothetical protein
VRVSSCKVKTGAGWSRKNTWTSGSQGIK